MSKGFTELFGWFLFTLVDFPAVDHHVVIGTGTDALPVMKEVKREAKRRKIKLVIVRTRKAIQELKQGTAGTNALLN